MGDVLTDADALPPEEYLMQREQEYHVADSLDFLSPREEHVLRMRYGLGDDNPHTLQEVGDELQLSRERVRQIEVKALEKISQRDSAGSGVLAELAP